MGISEVRGYWEAAPCAAKLAVSEPGSKAFYSDIEAAKNRLEPHEAAFADFQKWSGRTVLEIGCGVGIDTARFARAGADITAIDLTEAAVSLANQLLELEGLPGEAVVANAEQLPFPDGRFDLVYSWGVLHHTPNIDQAMAEVHRVLKPGGQVRMMLYSRRSTFAFAVWGRQVLRERRVMSMRDALSRGLESPGTKAFTPAKATSLLRRFDGVRVKQVATRYDRQPFNPLGWHLLIQAQSQFANPS